MTPTPNPSSNRPMYRNEESCRSENDGSSKAMHYAVICQARHGNKSNTQCHTFAREIASQPMMFGTAATINDCKTVTKLVSVSFVTKYLYPITPRTGSAAFCFFHL